MNITMGRAGDIGAWAPVQRVAVAGIDVAVARQGRGMPVVCLHAIAHGARDFEPLARRVADSCEIIAVDWPGHGASGAAVEAASAASYARLLEALLPELTSAPSVVIGCSIGGAAAIRVAATRPDLVRALVLCNSGGLLPVDAFTRRATGLMRSFFAAGARRARWYRPAFDLYYRMVLPEPPARERRDRIVEAAYETAPRLAEAWATFGEPDADLRHLIPSIGQPTLFAWATKDRILPWWRHRKVAASFPDHRIALFRGGHAAFLEAPDEFAAAFVEFMATLDGRSAPQAVRA